MSNQTGLFAYPRHHILHEGQHRHERRVLPRSFVTRGRLQSSYRPQWVALSNTGNQVVYSTAYIAQPTCESQARDPRSPMDTHRCPSTRYSSRRPWTCTTRRTGRTPVDAGWPGRRARWRGRHAAEEPGPHHVRAYDHREDRCDGARQWGNMQSNMSTDTQRQTVAKTTYTHPTRGMRTS